MYHSITFGDKNTWDDWHLIPSSRPVFRPPAVKTKVIDLPAGNGSIDLTDSLTGYPVYQNREGSFEFIVDNDYGNWIDRYTEIMNYLHGRPMQAVLEDEIGYYYQGRFAVNDWKSSKDYSTITIDYNVSPYKWAIQTSLEAWFWDPFSFVNGIIRPAIFGEIAIPKNETKVLGFTVRDTGEAPVSPIFSVTKQTSFTMTDISTGSTSSANMAANASGPISGLTLCGGKWLKLGKQVALTATTTYDDDTVSILFRPGRL